MVRLYTNIAVLLIAGLLGGMAFFVYQGQQIVTTVPCSISQIPPGGSTIGGEFTLIDQTGQTVTDKDVLGKPSLVYFGFTSCNDVCPIDNARNAAAVDLLQAKGFAVTPVFISIDPERDTPDVVAAYVKGFHDNMIGLTGSAEQVKIASLAYKTYYKRASSRPDYQMDHTAFTYLVMPNQGFIDLYRPEVTPAEMANSVSCFIKAA
ncbi:MAG: SCO family protein [Alphaproteobacteria bacterium]|nr:SCO family protein [Alphaproteobacteria bacterium]